MADSAARLPGTLDPAPYRREPRGLIESEWRVSDALALRTTPREI